MVNQDPGLDSIVYRGSVEQGGCRFCPGPSQLPNPLFYSFNLSLPIKCELAPEVKSITEVKDNTTLSYTSRLLPGQTGGIRNALVERFTVQRQTKRGAVPTTPRDTFAPLFVALVVEY
jgi:hypothetical protein